MTYNNGYPSQTTSGAGLFNGARSTGLIQGHAFPDPATRNALQSGIVSQGETLPMFGGLGIFSDLSPISASGPAQVLGPVIGRATSLATLTGFSCSDQAYNLVSDPNSPVPTAGSGQSMNFYALGSRARLAVAADEGLIDMRGSLITSKVSWDFVAQKLIPYSAPYSQAAITNAVWSATTGGEIAYTVGTDLTATLGVGDDIEIGTIVQTGGAGGNLNGSFIILAITANTITVSAPAAAGFYPTYVSGGDVMAGGGALPVTLLDIQPVGNMVASYNSITGLTTWNYSGSAAIIQLTGGTVS